MANGIHFDIDPAAIDDVIVGCVTQAGEQTFAFGRNVVLASKLPDSVPRGLQAMCVGGGIANVTIIELLQRGQDQRPQ